MTTSITKDELFDLKSLESSLNDIIKRSSSENPEEVEIPGIIKSYLTESFSEAIVKIIPYLEKYKGTPFLELEIRIGYIEDNGFSTCIGEDFFNKITKVLENTPVWSNSIQTESEDHFSNGMRMSVNLEEETETVIIKKKLCTLDFTFTGTPFDIRISFSTETPVPIDEFEGEEVNYKRIKKRNSFEYECWNYDTTIVSTTENSVENKTYEVELEINRSLNAVLNEMSPYYFLHSTFLKIRDIVNICENIEKESSLKLEFVQEKLLN